MISFSLAIISNLSKIFTTRIEFLYFSFPLEHLLLSLFFHSYCYCCCFCFCLQKTIFVVQNSRTSQSTVKSHCLIVHVQSTCFIVKTSLFCVTKTTFLVIIMSVLLYFKCQMLCWIYYIRYTKKLFWLGCWKFTMYRS